MMKKSLLLLLAVFTLVSAIQAQSFIGQNWKLKRVGAQFGQDQDRLSVMDYNYFLSSMRQAPGFNFSDIGATEQHTYSMLCENPHLRLSANFQHTNIPELELGLSLVGIFGRIDEVVYATPGANYWDEDRQELRFTQYGNEIAIEPTVSYRLEKSGLALTGIVGSNVGYHFGNYLNIYGHNITICDDIVSFREGISDPECETIDYIYESGAQRNGFSARAFAEIQGSFTLFRRFEMGVNYRRGIGFRTVNQSETVGTNLYSGGLFVRWVLRS